MLTPARLLVLSMVFMTMGGCAETLDVLGAAATAAAGATTSTRSASAALTCSVNGRCYACPNPDALKMCIRDPSGCAPTACGE